MPPNKSHEQCLELVCAVCTNLNGYKAKQAVSEIEVLLIQKHVFPPYQKDNIFLPQGICVRCALDLRHYDRQKQQGQDGGRGPAGDDGSPQQKCQRTAVKLKLPDDYICTLPVQTRSSAVLICSCRWCHLARLAGGELMKWRASLKKAPSSCITRICADCGRGVPVTVKTHTCIASDQERVTSLVQSLPSPVQAKLTLALIRKQQKKNSNSDLIALPQLEGGHSVQVTVGKMSVKPLQPVPLNVKEVQVMSSKAHLTGAQQQSILADLRCKWGKAVVEAGMQKALPEHNRKFSQFYSSKKLPFLTSSDEFEEKTLFFCHSPVELLQEVDRLRGKEGVKQVNLIQGDSGQGYTKIVVSRVSVEELEKENMTRIPGAGLVYMETGEEGDHMFGGKKKRRSREEGIKEGVQFEDWGVRRMIPLAVVHKVTENAHNLETIFNALNINNLEYRLTGDFAFFMPLFGLLKGCSSCNPCPICDQERSKEGGDGAKWVESSDVNLRSFGSLLGNFYGWLVEGERVQASHTKKWKSVTGQVMVMGEGDNSDTLVLDKLIPGPLHMYLAVNDIINHCEKTCWEDLKTVLYRVAGVQVHEYQGKVGNYEGPSIRKILKRLGDLENYMEDADKKLYLEALMAFKTVSESVFGKQLHPQWRVHLYQLKDHIRKLASLKGLSITPKLHVLTVHVEQWVDRHSRAMGRESESPGEAFHHLWKREVEGKGEVKDKQSQAYEDSTLQTLLKLAADNV